METITYLSDTIFQIQVVSVEDLREALGDERLEGFDIAGFKLSAAITNCLADCIQLVTNKSKGPNSTSFSCTHNSR
jgi:hypothetical protein